MNNLSPIILTVYNRPEHTKKVIEALKANRLASESILYVFSDAPKKEDDIKKVKEIRKNMHSISGFKEIHIIERKENFGLAKSIIEGVSEIFEKYNKIIAIEDDMLTSPEFLTYMNYFLNKYEKEKRIFSITGFGYPETIMKIPSDYKYDIYFSPRAGAWGWSTWKDRWIKVGWETSNFKDFLKDKSKQREFNKLGKDRTALLDGQMKGLVDSWAIRWDYAHFKNNKYCIFPVDSYIENIGMDKSGIHCDSSSKFDQIRPLSNKVEWRIPKEIFIDDRIVENFKRIFKYNPLKHFAYSVFVDTLIYKFYRKLKSRK